MNQGIDILEPGDAIHLHFGLKDSAGAIVTSGTTTIRLLEDQADGSFKTYDFASDTFKASGMTTGGSTASMTHRTSIGNADAVVNTGIWGYVFATLTGFTAGKIYIAKVTNSLASPPEQERKFQYGVSSAAFNLFAALTAAGIATQVRTELTDEIALLNTIAADAEKSRIIFDNKFVMNDVESRLDVYDDAGNLLRSAPLYNDAAGTEDWDGTSPVLHRGKFIDV